jgi:DNA-binding response OmpR family regulator
MSKGTAMAALGEKRIAIIEDDGALALQLRETLEEAGADVVYEARDLPGAMAAAALDQLDAAIVDVKLFGASSYPAALMLRRNGVSVVLASAEPPSSVPAPLAGSPFVRKPYAPWTIVAAVRVAAGGA